MNHTSTYICPECKEKEVFDRRHFYNGQTYCHKCECHKLPETEMDDINKYPGGFPV